MSSDRTFIKGKIRDLSGGRDVELVLKDGVLEIDPGSNGYRRVKVRALINELEEMVRAAQP
jgi:hypothetical protein